MVGSLENRSLVESPRRFVGCNFTEKPLPGLGVEWTAQGSPVVLDDFLGGLWEGRWTSASAANRRAFELEIERNEVVVIRNGRLSRWFEWLKTGQVPFNPQLPLFERGYHYDGEGRVKHVGLFHRGHRRREYGTSIARTADVQSAMQASKEILNPSHGRLSEIKNPQIKGHFRSIYEMLSGQRTERIDYIQIAIVQQRLMRLSADEVEQYVLRRNHEEQDLVTALDIIETFYDAVDELLDKDSRGPKRYVHDHDEGGVPSAIFFYNTKSAAPYRDYFDRMGVNAPLVHGRTRIPRGASIQAQTPIEPVAPLRYYLF